MSLPIERVLACPSLPSLPAIAVELLNLTRNPNVTIAQIAKVVQNDAALCAKVLKTVNSSFYGLPQKCSKIDRALGLLGLNTVKAVVLGFSLVETTSGMKSAGGFDIDAYWKRSMYAAAAARTLATVTGAADPEEAFTGSLFSDIGVLASVVALGDEYSAVVQQAAGSHSQLNEIEQMTLGFSHTEVGAALAKKWNLGPIYEPVIRFHHRADAAPESIKGLTRTVAAASMMAECLSCADSQKATAALRQKASSWFGDQLGDLEPLLNKIADSAQELARLFGKKIGEKPNIGLILSQASEAIIGAQIESSQQNRELTRQASTDGLTGAANRKSFDAALVSGWNNATSGLRPLAVIFIDADRFKSVNDTHGHQAGDAVLVELASRITRTVGARGTVYRYGGEEFAVLLPGSTMSDALKDAELVRRAVEFPPFDLSHVPDAPRQLPVTVSLGVAAHEAGAADHPDAGTMLKAADAAMYDAKQAGRNRVCGAKGNAAPALSMGTRIMLVEDDALAAKLLHAALSRQTGVEVVCIGSADEALRTLGAMRADSANRPNLVLVDSQLGRRSGLEVIAAINNSAVLRGTPVLLISSCDEADGKSAAASAGALGFISKTEIAKDLAKGIARIMTFASSRQASRAA